MLKLIIADDHAIVRQGLIRIIRGEYPDAAIREAGNGDELLKMIAESIPDLIICDINMPGKTGVDALKTIKENWPGLPVLMLSMYPEDPFALKVFRSGAYGYLRKDTVHNELLPAMKLALQGKKYITPAVAELLANSVLSDSPKPLHELLSERELEIFKMLAEGKHITDIAAQLGLHITTISTHRSRILRKMGMQSNADLVRYSIEQKVV